MAVRSHACVWGRSIAGIAGSNAAEGMDVRVLCPLCVVSVAVSATGWSLVVRSPTECICLVVRDLETSKRGGLSPIWVLVPQKKKSYTTIFSIQLTHK